MVAIRPLRALGIGISVLGLALAVASLTQLTLLVCSDPGGCRTEFHWPTLWTAFGLVVLGLALVAAEFVSHGHRGA